MAVFAAIPFEREIKRTKPVPHPFLIRMCPHLQPQKKTAPPMITGLWFTIFPFTFTSCAIISDQNLAETADQKIYFNITFGNGPALNTSSGTYAWICYQPVQYDYFWNTASTPDHVIPGRTTALNCNGSSCVYSEPYMGCTGQQMANGGTNALFQQLNATGNNFVYTVN